MAQIDLDVARAARREASGDVLQVQLGGKKFDLPPEMPIGVAESLAVLASRDKNEQDATPEDLEIVLRALGALFMNEQDWVEFRALASIDDLFGLMDGVFGHYGVSLGKLQPSASSSTGSTANSKRTGRKSTRGR